ncbi:MAG: Rpn family recombination-promoting nuclease/putative transposase, partial [Spirochaetaceae bacterium]|nr:Rpn family recombination-promoting nuclease/putative transposase [Spirochaetaceae bacterium]
MVASYTVSENEKGKYTVFLVSFVVVLLFVHFVVKSKTAGGSIVSLETGRVFGYTIPMGVNTKYKDSVFSFLFSDPDALRELYSAIEGVPLDPAVPITVNTLSGVLYMEQYNDISFTIGNKIVVLIEHQSTINPNMPLRLLLYIARVYEYIIDQRKKGSLYREKLIKIPFPEFIVLYNGVKPYPSQVTLKLSDCFEAVAELTGRAFTAPELELVVRVYNINKGHNEDIVRRSEKLRGYSTFIARIRENLAKRSAEPQTLEGAMKEAIEYCIANNILSAFLIKHSTEVRNML